MYFIIGKPHSIFDLNGHFETDVNKNRKETSIGIIDDEIFPKTNTLRNHDFNIRELGDINDIKATLAYQIVLCDIKGVGKSFGSVFEGGHIIEEIHKYYPNKVIIAYTGERLDPTYNKYLSIADQILSKDTKDDEWINILDDALEIVHNPIEQWRKARKRLLELSISSNDLMRVEDIFVESHLKKSNLFEKNKYVNIMKSDIKAVILNIAASFIFKAMVG